MNLFTKKLIDWSLVDCAKFTIGTLIVGYIGTRFYEEWNRKQCEKTEQFDNFDDDVYCSEKEEETSE